MSKAILVFNLPEEQYEYDALMKAKRDALEHSRTLNGIYGIARSELKHGLGTLESLTQALEKIKALSYVEEE